jgi:dTDP-4-dehydrorhamnose 3,5-epimerase
MQILTTKIPDVLLIKPTVFTDPRGANMELYRQEQFKQAGIPPFLQENLSYSIRGVLRGLHYQIIQPQGKLLRVASGEIFDVAVDLRRSSSTFGKWVSVNLKAVDREQFWIPAGFAHGFYVLSELAELVYKMTDTYNPIGERTLRWDDPDLHIDWPIPPGELPLLSAKDSAGVLLRDLPAADLFD